MPDELPKDPLTQLQESIAQAHELFMTALAQGFTEPQALYLVAAIVTGGPKEPPK